MNVRIYFPSLPYPCQDGASWVVAGQISALLELGHSVELVTWQKSRGQTPVEVKWTDLSRLLSRPRSRLGRAAQSLLSGRAMPELAHYPLKLASVLERAALTQVDCGIYHYSFAAALLLRGNGRRRERKVIVHFHNRESELAKLRGESALAGASWIHQRNARLLEEEEERLTHAANRVDALWFVSPTDRETFSTSERTSLFLAPPTFPRSLASTRGAEPGSKPTFGLIGRLDFEPNLRSATWIVEELAPELSRKSFQGRIEIVGRRPPRSLVAKAASFPFLSFEGFVEDVESYWRRWSGLLVPDLGGSGTRTKLLEALASGVPVLANLAALVRLVPELLNSPAVIRKETPEEWSESLTSLDWPALRSGLATLPFPATLDGASVYRGLGF